MVHHKIFERNIVFCIITWACILFTFNNSLYSQPDSSVLRLNEMHWENIQFEKKRLLDVVISGSRTEEQRRDATDKVYVITREEILENGYFTLVDVMSSLPGIKTSQPGSAQDGETFYMRGLLGNTYAKILINDVPIKSFIAKSVGISSQLPIRQAERIEVIYGTKASIYGVDASAGIINIILPQGKGLTDNDFYVDIGYGSNNLKRVNFSTSNSFKIGRKALTTSLYGGFTQFDDWDIVPKEDTSLYRLDNYVRTTVMDSSGNELDSIRSFLPHYDRENYSGTEENPELGGLPGESNYIGMSAEYGDFTLSGFYASRQDHTGIGRSSIFTTYYNSLNYYKENTLSLNLAYEKHWSKIGIKTNVNYLNYEIDPESNENKISTPFVEIIDRANGDYSDLALAQYERFVDGTRYSYAYSREWEIDQLFFYNHNRFLNATVGVKWKHGMGNPISSIFESSELAAASVDSMSADYQLYSAFIQNTVNLSKFKFDIGMHYSYYDIPSLQSDAESNKINSNLSYQLSGLYNINKTSQLRARYGTAFRIPSPYYRSQSFTAIASGLGSLNLLPEFTYSGELIYSWTPSPKWSIDASTYWSKTKNLINFGLQVDSLSRIPSLVYDNEENDQIELYGIQAQLKAKKLNLPLKPSFDLMLNFVQGHETNVIELLNGVDTAMSSIVYPALQGYPSFIGQFNVTFQLLENLHLKLLNTYNSKTLAIGQSLNNPLDEFQYSDSFYKLNLQINYRITPNITLSGRVNNVFDNDYSGIDATDQIENLLYNPQPRRNFFISLNYTLNN